MAHKQVAWPPVARRREPTEPFHERGRPAPFSLGDFWAWSFSGVLDNTLRGIVAEYLVAQALGVADGVRTEWEPYDLRTESGITVEVKSAAYLQNWAQQKLSTPAFRIGPTIAWDAQTNEYDTVRRRQADVYVFALLHHQDRSTVDPLDIGQWEFLVLPTRVLDEQLPTQKSLGLGTLLKLQPVRCSFDRLGEAVEEAMANPGPSPPGVDGA